MPDMIDRIARIICPEAFDRDAFRRIVKESNDGHTAGIDVEASMTKAQDAARVKARDVWAGIAQGAQYDRLIDWIRDDDRAPAITAFTAGPERNVAYAVEDMFLVPARSAAAKVLRNPATSKRAKTAAGKGMTQR